MNHITEFFVDQNKLLPDIVEFQYQPYMDFYSQCKPFTIYPIDDEHYYYIPSELRKNLLQFKARITEG
jgi:hypothetical protein